MMGGGTVPLTVTILFCFFGSLLMLASVAICTGFKLKPIGMNWIVTSRVLPGGMTSGKGTTPTTLNSSELDVMLLTLRSQPPLLPMVSVLLFVLPGQVLSKTMGSLTTIIGAAPTQV